MQQDNLGLDGEIDLRGLIRTLLKYKWWLVGISVGAAVAVFLIAQFALPKTYTSRSLVVFSTPTLDLNPTSTLALNVSAQAASLPDPRGITDLVVTDDLLQSIFESPDLAASRQQGLSFSGLRAELTASLSGNTQVLLEVRDADPQRAALIANLWARRAASRLNTLYGSSDANVSGLQKQSDTAQQEWDAAEKALLDYLAKSPIDSLSAQLSQMQIAYNSRLARVQSIDLILSDGHALDTMLGARQATEPLGTSDALGLLALQQRANEVLTCRPQALPGGEADTGSDVATTGSNNMGMDCSASSGLSGIQLQLTDGNMLASQSTTGGARADLKSFVDALGSQQTELKDGLAAMETQLSNLRAQLESEQSAVDQLRAKRDLAKDAYEAAYSQMSSMRIEMSSSSGLVAKVAGTALPATSPSNRVVIYAVGAAVAAFIATVFVLLLLDWWRRSPSSESRS